MKTLFKVWNILIIIGASLILLGIILAVFGIGTLGTSVSGLEVAAGMGILMIAVASLPAIISAVLCFITAKAGLSQDYEKCIKFGTIILLLSAISLVIGIFNGGSVGSDVIWTFFTAVYLWLAKKM